MTIIQERLEEFGRAWRGGEVDKLMELVTDDCVFHSSVGPNPGATFRGRDEVRRGFELMLAFDAGAEGVDGGMIIAGDHVFSRWSYRNVGDDGRPVEVRGCDLITFRDGRIAVKDAYRKVQGDLGE